MADAVGVRPAAPITLYEVAVAEPRANTITITKLVLQFLDEHPHWSNAQVADEVRRRVPGAKTTPASVSSIKSKALAKQGQPVRETRRQGASWPVWPQPDDKDLLELARTLIPFIRFLHPAIVGTVVEDNQRMGTDWSARLEAIGIDPAIYLWDGSPCAFPGIRRYAGSTEIALFRQRVTASEVPPQCLALDDNDYPKHLWAFVFTGKPFRKRGPDRYQLAHLFDHKEHGNRWQDELERLPGANEQLPLYGLFTSAANSAYVPSAFLRPTDFSPTLRSLIQRRALQIYGNICRIVPPAFRVKSCEDRNWDLDRFQWSAPVGDTKNVPDFLEFRRKRMGDLIDKRHGNRGPRKYAIERSFRSNPA